MRKLIWELSKRKGVRQALKASGAFSVANWWLRRYPLYRSFRESDIKCRVSNVVNLTSADEIAEAYPAAAIPHDVRTFCDLGCNCGYFQLWLKLVTGRDPSGLMIDANVNLRTEAIWHSKINRFRDVHCYTGLVGANGAGDFYLHTSNVSSSIHQLPGKGWTKVRIPTVCVGQLWANHFGDTPCDLLKINIEGAELSFLRREPTFLRKVKRIIVEVNDFANSIADVQAVLADLDFKMVCQPYGPEGFEFCVFERP